MLFVQLLVDCKGWNNFWICSSDVSNYNGEIMPLTIDLLSLSLFYW